MIVVHVQILECTLQYCLHLIYFIKQVEGHFYSRAVVSVSWHYKNPTQHVCLVQNKHHLIKRNLLLPEKLPR